MPNAGHKTNNNNNDNKNHDNNNDNNDNNDNNNDNNNNDNNNDNNNNDNNNRNKNNNNNNNNNKNNNKTLRYGRYSSQFPAVRVRHHFDIDASYGEPRPGSTPVLCKQVGVELLESKGLLSVVASVVETSPGSIE
ncbi:unnamed protein product [Polarella glacialis]|uniref:Uncharacterized protein n=1 Tax=Polarella glacialis TaxID=89957 RepID=A0A813E5Y1_POLGL|nr:unnamed protein product [Polarella glacialis]